jgi:hypothetical protein
MLRRILGSKRDEVTGEWRRLHNEELFEPYFSPSIIGMIKSRIMRWSGHAARMGVRRGSYWVLVGKPGGQNHLEDLGVDKGIILKLVLKK